MPITLCVHLTLIKVQTNPIIANFYKLFSLIQIDSNSRDNSKHKNWNFRHHEPKNYGIRVFFQLTHFSSFKFKLIPILEPKFSLEINSCDIKVIITLKFESFSWSIQWNSTWFKPIPVLGPTGNPIFRFYVIENLGTISYKPLQLLLQKWHFSDKNSAITRRGIKISKNGLHPRIRRTILHRHTNFQPNLSHSGNHLFPVDTLTELKFS